MITNTVTVAVLPGREPISVTRASLSIDELSWVWSMQIEVAGRASFHQLLPGAEPKEVEITINGEVWVMICEDLFEDRSGTTTRFTVSGRGRAAYLAAPYAPARSFTSTESLLASQLADLELENTGFTLDWQAASWSIPAGAWSYADLTPMGALTRIAEACGAMVQPDPQLDVIRIVPRYKALPWRWGLETPDVSIPAQAATQLTRRRIPGPKYHGVWITGETQGSRVNVYRPESPSGPYAQMIIDPLTTASAPAIARGGALIADAQDRTEQPIVVPMPPDTTGVIKPGDLVEVSDTVYGTWRARNAATSISAQVSETGATTVRQEVRLIQHYEDIE